ncbi:MAG: hypothetical protein AB7P40_11310 [Chloroflexota bacterium]
MALRGCFSRLLDWRSIYGATMRDPCHASTTHPHASGRRLRWWRRRPSLSGIRTGRQSGQAVVEAALTTLISVITVVVVLQLSLVVAQLFGTAHVARETSRWLAVRIDTIDSAVVAQANTYAANLPGVGSGGISSVTVTPSCVSLTSGKCASRDTGDAVTVSVRANLARVMFLPMTYGIPPLQFRLPSTMPAIAYTVLLE